jgi:hypothetical protein
LPAFLRFAIKRLIGFIPVLQIIALELAVILGFVGLLNKVEGIQNFGWVLAVVFIIWSLAQGHQIASVVSP